MEFVSRYVSKETDNEGYANYSDEENETWKILYQRQQKIIPGRACDEHLKGLQVLDINPNAIPQLPDVNKKLKALTGWQVSPVKSLISHEEFFDLLANRFFPAATFIRVREELDYVKEPDIFHELYGHCPMLTHPEFSDFVATYAQKVLSMDKDDWPLMQRLFWFTVEFGLIQTSDGLRAYGGGILSSIGETPYCIESPEPQRQLFNPLVMFRTPYRIDMMQPVYFVINRFDELYDFIQSDFMETFAKARELGEFPALFPVDKDNPNIHIMYC